MDQFKLHQCRRLNFKIHGNQKPKNEGKKSVKNVTLYFTIQIITYYIKMYFKTIAHFVVF